MSNLVLPNVPVVFEIRMQGSINDMNEVQAASWLQGKLSTLNLNGTLEIKVRRLTPEELAGLGLVDALAVGARRDNDA